MEAEVRYVGFQMVGGFADISPLYSEAATLLTAAPCWKVQRWGMHGHSEKLLNEQILKP